MKLSTRAQYGTRALLYLAVRQEKGPATLKDIARSQQIPLSYLEHLMTPLIAGGVVRSVRGPRGGVALARSSDKIKLDEVVQLLEGSSAPVECVDNPNVCDRSRSCVTRDVWSDLKRAVDTVLESTTLQDLVERQKRKQPSEQEMYYI
ncbi:MAG: Rrf2 family transcriptional regulator [Chloroflexi bacterium]|nr:Rrf2 family transcriptional regulator [Chloroflexota bacterium]